MPLSGPPAILPTPCAMGGERCAAPPSRCHKFICRTVPPHPSSRTLSRGNRLSGALGTSLWWLSATLRRGRQACAEPLEVLAVRNEVAEPASGLAVPQCGLTPLASNLNRQTSGLELSAQA